jgi:hypothetical protein
METKNLKYDPTPSDEMDEPTTQLQINPRRRKRRIYIIAALLILIAVPIAIFSSSKLRK